MLESATKHFARRGFDVSLREIADDANVNLGLIHRHFGNKRDVVDAVLAHQRERGHEAIAGMTDPAAAIRRMFELSADNDDFARIVAWLALESHERSDPVDGYPAITEVRRTGNPSAERDRRLMAAMTLLYGWALFRDEVMHSFGYADADRGVVERDLAALLEQLVREADVGS